MGKLVEDLSTFCTETTQVEFPVYVFLFVTVARVRRIGGQWLNRSLFALFAHGKNHNAPQNRICHKATR